MTAPETPPPVIPPAELAHWAATLRAVEETDRAAGRIDPAIANARAACNAAHAAANGRRSRG